MLTKEVGLRQVLPHLFSKSALLILCLLPDSSVQEQEIRSQSSIGRVTSRDMSFNFPLTRPHRAQTDMFTVA